MQPIASLTTVPVQAQGNARPALPPAARRADAPQARAAAPEPHEVELRKAIEAANVALRQVTNDLEFARDDATGKTVLRVIDASTRQVIRQFPSEEMLAIARALDRFEGLVLRQKA